eukprot:SAG31_NODE_76_length_27534_cov_13.661868_3_plen_616_part_00
MAFAARLRTEKNPSWEGHYVDYESLKKHILAASEVQTGTVYKPDELTTTFISLLQGELRRVDDFYVQAERDLANTWDGVKAALPAFKAAACTDAERTVLSVLKSHVQRTCKATPGKCSAVARLERQRGGEAATALANFVLAHEQAQMLRQFVTLNHLGFTRLVTKFEGRTGLSVQFFVASVEAAKFYLSPTVSRLLTDMECTAKDLLVKVDEDSTGPGAGVVRQELQEGFAFTCGVCLDILKKPVVLSCGHRFCWHCAASSCVCAASSVGFSCPLCRRVQSMTLEVFTVSEELEAFISEHVHQRADDSNGGASHSSLHELPAMSPSDSEEVEMTFSEIVSAKEHAWNGSAAERDTSDGGYPLADAASSLATETVQRDLKKEGIEIKEETEIHPVAIATAVATAVDDFGQLHDPLPQKFVGKTVSNCADYFSMLIDESAIVEEGEAAGTDKQALTKKGQPRKPRKPRKPKTKAATNSTAVTTVDKGPRAPTIKRKRGRPPADASLTAEERKTNRALKNRLAAQRSHQRRIEYAQSLERSRDALQAELASQGKALQNALQQWRLHADFLTSTGLWPQAAKRGLIQPPLPEPSQPPPDVVVSGETASVAQNVMVAEEK